MGREQARSTRGDGRDLRGGRKEKGKKETEKGENMRGSQSKLMADLRTEDEGY